MIVDVAIPGFFSSRAGVIQSRVRGGGTQCNNEVNGRLMDRSLWLKSHFETIIYTHPSRATDSTESTVATASLSRAGQPWSRNAYSASAGQQLADLFARQRLCGVMLQIGGKMLRSTHPQNRDGDALD
jgi:hypothetical protein